MRAGTFVYAAMCSVLLAACNGDGVDPTAVRLAADLSITEVAIYQGVAIPLMRNGAVVAERNAPVIVGREALVRVFVARREDYTPRALTATLRLGDQVLTDTRTITGDSTDESLDSTFLFHIPAGATAGIARDLSWSIALADPAAPTVALGEPSSARFPLDGASSPLDAIETGTVRVLLVPLSYEADGSGRLPDTSPEQLERFRRAMYTQFPTTGLELSVHAPVPFGKDVPSMNGFDPVDTALVALRTKEQPPADLYYFGLISPTATRDAFCARGCTTGRSHIESDPLDASQRVGAGLGFPGDAAADTFVHELGHLHGRRHAPCLTRDADPDYPYPKGQIGGWGWNILSSTLMPPTSTDFMGYCDNSWVSDYTYRGLAERIVAVNTAAGRLRVR